MIHDQHWPAQFPEKFHYFVQVLPPVPCTCNILKEIGESGTKQVKDKIIVRERKRERERERERESTTEYERVRETHTTQHNTQKTTHLLIFLSEKTNV